MANTINLAHLGTPLLLMNDAVKAKEHSADDKTDPRCREKPHLYGSL